MKLIGYVTSRPFGGFCIPVPAQNTCLREYANKINIKYSIPQLEHKFDNCFMQLYSTIEFAAPRDEIVMYSSEMMPDYKKFKQIMSAVIEKKIKIHFVLENTVIENFKGMYEILRSRKIRDKIISRDRVNHIKKNLII